MVRKLSEERREQFLQAALKLFVRNGVQKTSTAAIAREAGSAAGTLFLYFPTKQNLIDELILDIGRKQADFFKETFDPDQPVRDIFFSIWESSLRWFLDHPQAFLYVQQVRDTGLISESATRDSGKFYDYYYLAIQKGFAEGRIKPYPIDLIGGYLYADIVATMNMLLRESDRQMQSDLIEMGFSIFWDGINQGPKD